MSIIQHGSTSTLTYKNKAVTNRAPITFYGNNVVDEFDSSISFTINDTQYQIKNEYKEDGINVDPMVNDFIVYTRLNVTYNLKITEINNNVCKTEIIDTWNTRSNEGQNIKDTINLDISIDTADGGYMNYRSNMLIKENDNYIYRVDDSEELLTETKAFTFNVESKKDLGEIRIQIECITDWISPAMDTRIAEKFIQPKNYKNIKYSYPIYITSNKSTNESDTINPQINGDQSTNLQDLIQELINNRESSTNQQFNPNTQSDDTSHLNPMTSDDEQHQEREHNISISEQQNENEQHSGTKSPQTQLDIEDSPLTYIGYISNYSCKSDDVVSPLCPTCGKYRNKITNLPPIPGSPQYAISCSDHTSTYFNVSDINEHIKTPNFNDEKLDNFVIVVKDYNESRDEKSHKSTNLIPRDIILNAKKAGHPYRCNMYVYIPNKNGSQQKVWMQDLSEYINDEVSK